MNRYSCSDKGDVRSLGHIKLWVDTRFGIKGIDKRDTDKEPKVNYVKPRFYKADMDIESNVNYIKPKFYN